MKSHALAFAALLAAAPAARADDVPPETKPAETGVAFEPGTPAFADVLAKAKAAGKPAFVDFQTVWCGWCKKLDKDVFSQAETAETMKGFVNVHVDAEKGEGVDLAKRYGVHGYPTLLVVDATGDELDRVVGYRPLAEFNQEMKRILSGEGTIAALRKSYAASGEVETGITLGSKLAPSKGEEAASLFADLMTKTKEKDRATQAKVRLEYAGALAGAGKSAAAFEQAEALVREFADTPSAAETIGRVGAGPIFAADATRASAFLDACAPLAKDPQSRSTVVRLTIAVHQRALAASLKKQAEAAGDDAQTLNEIAWTCFEQKLNVKDALGWASTAVEKSERDPAILDTLANLQRLAGKKADAVKNEEEAAEKAKGKMKKEFLANVAKWKAEDAAKKEGDEKDEDGEEDDGDE